MRHGVDLGLEPDIEKDGQPKLDKRFKKSLDKNNKQNMQLFKKNLEKYLKNPNGERRKNTFHKDRQNACPSINFYDKANQRVVVFKKITGEFITFWKMNDIQHDEFIANNDVI